MKDLSRARQGFLTFTAVLIFLIVAGAVANRLYARNDTYKNLHNFNDSLDHIRRHYVDDKAISEVLQGAWFGLLESLDPQCAYLTPEQARVFKRADHEVTFPGLGLVMSKRHGYCVVIAALPGSPSGEAGISPGDYIRYINDKSTRLLNLFEAQDLLKGPSGTQVTLKVLKASNYEAEEIKLTRTEAALPPPSSEVVQGSYGLIRIPNFKPGTSAAVERQVAGLVAQGIQGVVVDLRGNSLGLLEEAVNTAGLFLGPADILRVKGRTRITRVMALLKPVSPAAEEAPSGSYSLLVRSRGARPSCALPLVVLVDRSTADAAEVLASAILDRKRGEVVGGRTFGAGSIQDLIPLSSQAGLILTVAKFYRLNGEALLDKGVEPSVPAQAAEAPEPGKAAPAGGDPVLEKGIETLKSGAQEPLKKAA